MYSLNRRPPWPVIAITLLTAPALSLAAAMAVVWGAGNALWPTLRLGMHTLVPMALVLPMPVLVAAAVFGLVLAGLAYACSSPKGRRAPIGAVQAASFVFAAQALLLAAQLVAVSQVNGIPDATLSLLAAAVLQALVLAVAMSATVAVGVVLAAAPARVRGATWLATLSRPATLIPIPIHSPVYRLGTQRGPPYRQSD